MTLDVVLDKNRYAIYTRIGAYESQKKIGLLCGHQPLIKYKNNFPDITIC